MELDELKEAWRELDRRPGPSGERAERAEGEFELDKARFALRRHGTPLFFELSCDAAIVVSVGFFLQNQFGVARFMLPALVLEVAALASIAAIVAQLTASLRIDYSAPVIAIQRRFAELRVARARGAQWTLLLAPLLWTPMAIVAAQGLFGLDIYAVVGPMFVALNLALGLVLIPLGIHGARLCAEQFGHSPFLKRLADMVSGNSLARAVESVDELERFQEE